VIEVVAVELTPPEVYVLVHVQVCSFLQDTIRMLTATETDKMIFFIVFCLVFGLGY
jgi:hypothetical protein